MTNQENMPEIENKELQKLRIENEFQKKQLHLVNTLAMAHADVNYKMNADWTRMLELNGPDAELAQQQPEDGWMELYIPSFEKERVQNEIQKAIEGKCMFEMEHVMIMPDGTDGWTMSRAVPVMDIAGNITHWMGMAIDITAKKKTELDLRKLMTESEQLKRLYETIISSTPDLVYVFDLDARFTYANTALLNMWGRTKEESFGKSLLEVGYEPWHAAMHEREIEHIKKTRQVVRGEVGFPHATLGKRVYDYILVPVLDANAEVTAVAGTTRDITEIKKLAEQKDEFLAIASHELKTPLTSIKAYGQVLQDIFGSRNDEEAVMMLGRMDKQINKLTGLITDLLDVNRIQSGKLLFNEELFNLSALVEDVIDGMRLTTTKHAFRKNIPGKIFYFGDMERIGQVITNLVTNAIKYSPAGGEIRADLKEKEDGILLSIEDFGIGIPAGNEKKVFEQFYRVNNYESTISGMGIGLYISAEIVERCDGKIWVESREGAGSIFYVSLPHHQ